MYVFGCEITGKQISAANDAIDSGASLFDVAGALVDAGVPVVYGGKNIPTEAAYRLISARRKVRG